MKVMVTGALGLVGSEAVRYYLHRGHEVFGFDNDMRSRFFGPEASVKNNRVHHPKYHHFDVDIRKTYGQIRGIHPDLIIHCAAQPSHDWAAIDPRTDFEVNGIATFSLLEQTRNHCPDAVFIYVSTNKVYGDNPNKFELIEQEKRYEIKNPLLYAGISELSCMFSIDQCTHSLFGCSKLTGDLYAQEYGRYFGLKTGIFRCGCITGGRHKSAPLHGFLAYVARCKKEGKEYEIHGYKGKQVRDNIHAFDLVSAFDSFASDPRPGEVYNMGGGRDRSLSVMEALERFEVGFRYSDLPRKGDHIWYISDVSKFQSHYPQWKYKYSLEAICEDLISPR